MVDKPDCVLRDGRFRDIFLNVSQDGPDSALLTIFFHAPPRLLPAACVTPHRLPGGDERRQGGPPVDAENLIRLDGTSRRRAVPFQYGAASSMVSGRTLPSTRRSTAKKVHVERGLPTIN